MEDNDDSNEKPNDESNEKPYEDFSGLSSEEEEDNDDSNKYQPGKYGQYLLNTMLDSRNSHTSVMLWGEILPDSWPPFLNLILWTKARRQIFWRSSSFIWVGLIIEKQADNNIGVCVNVRNIKVNFFFWK